MIPPRFIPSGNVPAAKLLEGFGTKLLGDLKTSMGFQGLDIGSSEEKFPDGTVIRCSVVKGVSTIRAYVPGGGGKIHESVECLCLPHFAMGVVVASKPGEPTEEFLLTGRLKYDIMVCARKHYLFYEDALDANCGRYRVGQIILVTMGEEMPGWEKPLDCDRSCLTAMPRFEYLTISPVHIPGKMQRWMQPEKSKRRE